MGIMDKYTCLVLVEYENSDCRALLEAPIGSIEEIGVLIETDAGDVARVVNFKNMETAIFAEDVQFVLDCVGATLPLRKVKAIVTRELIRGTWCDWSEFNKKQEADDEH